MKNCMVVLKDFCFKRHTLFKFFSVLENKTRIVIDDDIEIVGTKEAEIMSHIRSDCPLHPYV